MIVGSLLHLLLVLIILGAVFYVVWWAINQVPMPAPFNVVIRVIFALIVVLVAIYYLLPLANIR